MEMARGPPNINLNFMEKGDDFIQPIFPWIGGKQSLYKLIINRFPADYRQRKYVEVFGGGASVLLNKDRSAKEIYNDFNSSLVNMYRVVRENPLEFQNRLRYVLNSREDYDRIKKRLAHGHNKDPVQWAVDFYYLIKFSYGGGGTSFGGTGRFQLMAIGYLQRTDRILAGTAKPGAGAGAVDVTKT